MDTDIQNFEKECERIAFHINENIKEMENNFCIPYLESFIPDYMKTNDKFLSVSYIETNIFPKLAEYLDATIEHDASLKEAMCKMKRSDCILIMEFNCWFSRKDFDIEISGKIIRN